MATTRWPKEVPVLTADDIPRTAKARARALSRIAAHAFGKAPVIDGVKECTPIQVRVHDVFDTAIEPHRLWPETDWLRWLRKHTATQLAKRWNRAMARLGYVVGNPEAKNVKRKRK